MRATSLLFASILLLLQSAAAAVHAQPDDVLLKQAGLGSGTGADLVDFLAKRIPGETDETRLAGLVKQLADARPEVRAAAQVELIKFGPAAVPFLRPAANDLDNFDAAALARHCLQMIEGRPGALLITAVARTIAGLRPAGAVPALLAYLPFTDDDTAAAEVSRAIGSITAQEDKADPALVKALDDPSPARRSAAADALIALDQDALRPALRKLLKDPSASVRLRAALGLSNLNDEQAVPVLIDLLAELPTPRWLEAQAQLTRIAGEWAITVPHGDDPASRRVRRQTWRAWWESMDAATLLDEFRKRTPGNSKKMPPLPSAALRLIVLRKPAGAVGVLLAYFPFAENEAQRRQLLSALRTLAVRDGKLDPALVGALDDRLAARRLAAAEVLLAVGGAEQRAATRKLLKDADSLVRLRVALALVVARDREAIPALIDLLANLPPEQGAAAEDCLRRLAGETAPKVPLQGDETARRKCRDAWLKWWQEQGPGIDLAKLEDPRWLLGRTLIVEQFDNFQRTGRVLEIDALGKVCWQINDLADPVDAQLLPTGRVLISEAGGMRLTERTLSGKLLWERSMPRACVSFQRLPNGNTFIAMRHQVLEIDKDGKEVFACNRPGGDLFVVRKLPDGQIAYITTDEMYFRIDATQKELQSFRVKLRLFPNVDIQRLANAEILPGDHVLVTLMAPNPAQNKVMEYDGTGAVVWEATINVPSHAIRLANGNTLVASVGTRRVVELDRAGRVVWEYPEAIRAIRVHRK